LTHTVDFIVPLVGSECGGPATHTNWQTRTHYTSPETAPLVTSLEV